MQLSKEIENSKRLKKCYLTKVLQTEKKACLNGINKPKKLETTISSSMKRRIKKIAEIDCRAITYTHRGMALTSSQQTIPGETSYNDIPQSYFTPKCMYTCSICGNAFLFQSYLNRHMVKHSSHKPYKCDYCDARFTQTGSKNSHMKKRHNVYTID